MSSGSLQGEGGERRIHPSRFPERRESARRNSLRGGGAKSGTVSRGLSSPTPSTVRASESRFGKSVGRHGWTRIFTDDRRADPCFIRVPPWLKTRRSPHRSPAPCSLLPARRFRSRRSAKSRVFLNTVCPTPLYPTTRRSMVNSGGLRVRWSRRVGWRCLRRRMRPGCRMRRG